MKYSVGYSLIAEQQFNEAISSFKDHIAEIYFSWPGMKSGRASIVYNNEDYQQKVTKLIDDLSRYNNMGIPLTMLFNANCYGGEAISKQLEKSVIETIEFVQDKVACLKAVITASPFIASKIKLHFPNIQIRASVNMRINTTFAMEYLSDRFDFFYVAKELNRDIIALKNIKAWATAHGKQIGILVNSGCLNNCPNQTFHDNLVSHESEIENYDASYYQPVLCRNFIANQKNWHFLISGSNWIRPEDIMEYQEIFQTVKLATRMHSNPFMVIGAYSHGAHYGNILDLMEPGFSGILYPYILDNRKFPKKWSSGGANYKEDSSLLLEKVLTNHQLL
jgi:collagenase-like PrtC family protease